MLKKTDTDLLNAALLGLELRRQAVDRKIAEVRRLISEIALVPPTAHSSVTRQVRRRRRVASVRPRALKGAAHVPKQWPRSNDAQEDRPQVVTAFANKAGLCELIRVEQDQAYYSFTNRQGKTVDAVMPVVVWRRMQARAGRE